MAAYRALVCAYSLDWGGNIDWYNGSKGAQCTTGATSTGASAFKGLKCDFTVASAAAQYINFTPDYLPDFTGLDSNSIQHNSGKFCITALPSAQTWLFSGGFAHALGGIKLETSGALSIYRDDTTLAQTSTLLLSINTDYFIEIIQWENDLKTYQVRITDVANGTRVFLSGFFATSGTLSPTVIGETLSSGTRGFSLYVRDWALKRYQSNECYQHAVQDLVPNGNLTTETIRPDGDSSLGSWTDNAGGTTNIYTKIDESSVDDTDYVKDATDGTSVYTMTLANPTFTKTPAAVNLAFRYKRDVAGGKTLTLQVELLQGATQKATATVTVSSTSFATDATNLFHIDPTTITDFTDLKIRLTKTVSGAGAVNQVQVSWVYVDFNYNEFNGTYTDLDEQPPNTTDVRANPSTGVYFACIEDFTALSGTPDDVISAQLLLYFQQASAAKTLIIYAYHYDGTTYRKDQVGTHLDTNWHYWDDTSVTTIVNDPSGSRWTPTTVNALKAGVASPPGNSDTGSFSAMTLSVLTSPNGASLSTPTPTMRPFLWKRRTPLPAPPEFIPHRQRMHIGLLAQATPPAVGGRRRQVIGI